MITTDEHDPYKTIESCRKWIESALERGKFEGIETHTFEDVAGLIMSDNAQLWATDEGCIVTFITVYPKTRIFTIWLCAGKFDQVMDKMYEKMLRYAHRNECRMATVSGRKGWERKLLEYGFKPHQSLVARKL